MALETLSISEDDITTALEWGVEAWKPAFLYWHQVALDHCLAGRKGLEIGARHGGLSWHFARALAMHMTCTDVHGPTTQAIDLHRRYGLDTRIEYDTANALSLPYQAGQFDLVVFKSVLGALGFTDPERGAKAAVQEIYRVLKPGGVLLFAENLKATWVHQTARRLWRPWGKSWEYVSLAQLHDLLGIFSERNVYSTGFLSAFAGESNIPSRLAGWSDRQLEWLPDRWKYIAFGHAVKSVQPL